ncbi:hypothetical protein OEZ86_010446 [Tetradesmus obliquus]|nr:hypothetical protein OEZ86_010446 [Tetradesmus obliquus]
MGGAAAASSARVRIKGRKLSVVRFLIISIAYTTPWIIMLSQLAYYSKIYGPQVLLQLNIAYYLPSIPILLLLGHIEKILDEQFGSTASMAIRLTVGLTGCAAISALYPFIPGRLSYLLWLVVALGSISAVAFSTSYQLVAWFRSADTIALGIGCVASGPLALIIQLALHIGTTPKRWQWIGLFEAAAGLVLVGILAAWSLLWQYWNILCGKEEYVDSSTPLLDSAEQAAADHVDDEAGEAALMLSRMLTMQDPFQGFPFTTMPGMELPHLRPLLRRALSEDLSDIRRLTHRSAAAAAAARGLHRRGDFGDAESLGAVYWEVFKYCWSTVLAALVSSTLLNCIFPFFTYVESSGMLGEFLPQVLFYTRMLSDILGRLLPRKKALAITSPAALLALSGALLLCSVAFFVYLQVPPRMQYDPYVMVLVLALWLGGGYINTMGYILAPALVPPKHCTKASALMVIAYKASHILGLAIAIGLALWLYGDISGAL